MDGLVAARLGLQWDQRGAIGGAAAVIAGLPGAGFGPGGPAVPDGAEQTGHREGPIFQGLPWPSIGAALLLTAGISAALLAREMTGVGQRVETSLLQGSLLGTVPTWQRVDRPGLDGYRLPYFDRRHPKGFFRCADGAWVHQWAPIEHDFAQAAARSDELVLPSADERAAVVAAARATFTPDPGADAYEAQLAWELHRHPDTAKSFARFPSSSWVELFARAGLPCQPVRSPEEALNDPWSIAEGIVTEVDDPERGSIRQVGLVYRLHAVPGHVGRGAPNPGADTGAVRTTALVAAQPRPKPRDPAELSHALEGVSVVDLGMAMAGPYGTQILGDLGASVIKIHNPAERHAPVSGPTLACNRGKRSLALDLKDPRGHKVLLRLAAGADVVHHNLRTGVAQRLGADYATLQEVNPQLVYCHTRGFESTGPRVSLPGNDQMGQALAGSWFEMGAVGAGMPPSWHPAAMGDFGNGVVSAIAVIQALYHRSRTGVGQMVDTSILNVGLLYNSATFVPRDGSPPVRAHLDAGQHGFNALHRLYPTADGWLCLGLTEAEQWDALVTVAGDTLGRDPRFVTADLRDRNDEQLASALTAVLANGRSREWLSRFDRAGVPAEESSPAFIRALWDDDELTAVDRVVGYPHPTLGHVEQVGHLIELSATPGLIRGPAPLVGQHSRQILEELGMRSGDIDALIGAGVVWAG